MTLDVVLYQKPISPSLLSLKANRPRWKKNSTKKQNQNDYFIDEMNTINCLCFILIIGVNIIHTFMHHVSNCYQRCFYQCVCFVCLYLFSNLRFEQ